ncbi:hypothetical protein ACQFX9_14415 [Aliinostoc sp. HNIBRCY26]|uniref:hypothetical protein n=1 Tax=Aliinostoc sp. HNIBRCY26 TaxID=3418997 RepID=UPI003CFCCE6F
MVLTTDNLVYLPNGDNPNPDFQERLNNFLLIQQLVEAYIKETATYDGMIVTVCQELGDGIRVVVAPDDLIKISREALHTLLREAGYLLPLKPSELRDEDDFPF